MKLKHKNPVLEQNSVVDEMHAYKDELCSDNHLSHIKTEEQLVTHIVKQVMGAPDREDLIYELKNKIKNRLYNVSSEQIAQALLEESDIICKSYLSSSEKS